MKENLKALLATVATLLVIIGIFSLAATFPSIAFPILFVIAFTVMAIGMFYNFKDMFKN